MSRFAFSLPLGRMTNPGIKDHAEFDEDGDLLLSRRSEHLLLLGNDVLGKRICGT